MRQALCQLFIRVFKIRQINIRNGFKLPKRGQPLVTRQVIQNRRINTLRPQAADDFNRMWEKMIRRHPHVFGGRKVRDVDEIKANWREIKENLENKPRGKGILDGIPRSLPALLRAQKMTERASRVGFDWSATEEVLAKVEEELRELKAELSGGDPERIREELGDLLFSLVNLSRFARVDAEDALRRAGEKFARRFAGVERGLAAQGKTPGQASLAEMDRLWEKGKMGEKG